MSSSKPPSGAIERREMGNLNWDNLTASEKSEYMRLQMSPQGTYDRTGYLPDDCGECGVCGQPTLGAGWCRNCYRRWQELRNKLEAPPPELGKERNE